MPLVLAVECKIIESNPLRGLRGEGLGQNRIVSAGRGSIHASLEKGIKRLRDQYARGVVGVSPVCPIDSLKSPTKSELVIAVGLHEIV